MGGLYLQDKDKKEEEIRSLFDCNISEEVIDNICKYFKKYKGNVDGDCLKKFIENRTIEEGKKLEGALSKKI